MTNITAWREFLGKSIVDPHERQRIANELGVSTVTLTRWSNGIRTHVHRLYVISYGHYHNIVPRLLS